MDGACNCIFYLVHIFVECLFGDAIVIEFCFVDRQSRHNATGFDTMTEKTLNELLAEAIHQRDVLMDAITKTALAVNLYNGEAPIGGPHLLMFCDDFVDIIQTQAARIAELEGELGVASNGQPAQEKNLEQNV